MLMKLHKIAFYAYFTTLTLAEKRFHWTVSRKTQLAQHLHTGEVEMQASVVITLLQFVHLNMFCLHWFIGHVLDVVSRAAQHS